MPAQDLLLLLGQPPRVAHYAAEFVGWQLMGLPFIPAWLTMMTFLRPEPWMLQSPHGGHQCGDCSDFTGDPRVAIAASNAIVLH